MQLASVPLARVLAYIETTELNPNGSVFFPDLIQKIIERCEFQKYPQNFEQTNEEKRSGVLSREMGWRKHQQIDNLHRCPDRRYEYVDCRLRENSRRSARVWGG